MSDARGRTTFDGAHHNLYDGTAAVSDRKFREEKKAYPSGKFSVRLTAVGNGFAEDKQQHSKGFEMMQNICY